MSGVWKGPLEKIDDYRWKIPKSYKSGMRVDGIIYADDELAESIKQDQAPEQVANVAYLPGIIKHSLAMPDIHWGYGAPIGGVAAFDLDKGVISPGICGYDINCGVRLIRTNLFHKDTKDKIDRIVNQLFGDIPSGLGSKGDIKAAGKEMNKLLIKGAAWAVEKGYGEAGDLEYTEEKGALEGVDPDTVSERCYERGKSQAGTLGSGNHFIEVQAVDEIYDDEKARVFGLEKNQITVMIHSGSRGFGYQVCDDALRLMRRAVNKYKIDLPDRQLACAPFDSPEGRQYLSSMRAAANYAWCNRQVLMHLVRGSFEKVFGRSYSSLGMNLIYDVAHNIVKIEENNIDGKIKKVCVHRKGATRAYPAGHKDLPNKYKSIGQPVIIPGDMGTYSYLLVGAERAEETFYSTCHGAGRKMSRTEARRRTSYDALREQLKKQGIVARAHSRGTLVEEAPAAYKNIDKVVNVVDKAGISKKVLRMKPLGVVKG
jgi:tRNA-splicing ligase RtcB (3'-phosphate/5'-hydroxy nucleic acid ligase)